MKKTRKYLIYLDRSIKALRSAVDRLNSVHDEYRVEAALMLLSNAWELAAKAYLLRAKISIQKSDGKSISAEDAVCELVKLKALTEVESGHIQQVLSLRNRAMHDALPQIPDEIIFHLAFFGTKFFKDFVVKFFPAYAGRIKGNFLSIGFDSYTTYADKVQKLVARARRKDTDERELIWLLERGVRFAGGSYISQASFDAEAKKIRGKKFLPKLRLGKFIKEAEMVVVVPVQAPKGYTADISLRKGSKAGSALPIMVKKTEVEGDYPHLTFELADKLGKNTQFVARMITKLGLKGDTEFHQPVRTSKRGSVNRYSEKTLQKLKEVLAANPSYSPYD